MRFGNFGPTHIAPHYANYLGKHGYERPRILEAFFGDNPGKKNQEMYALHSGTIDHSYEALVSEETIRLLCEFKETLPENDKPFFIWANYWGPHTPCLLPEPYYSMYDPTEIPMEPSFTETWDRKPYVQVLYERFWGLSSGGWNSWRESIARYWGYVTMIDDLVGRILAELESLQLAEDTVIIFTTDHGDMMSAHRLIEKGPFMYDQCYRLPMVVAHPDCEQPGSICDEFIHLNDLFPILIAITGDTPPTVPDTTSILPNMLGQVAPTGRESAYSAFFQQNHPMEQRMVRTHTHKLVYNVSAMGELYDLNNDPWEMRNLIDLPETYEIQQQLLEMMREHMMRLDDPALRWFDQIRHVH